MPQSGERLAGRADESGSSRSSDPSNQSKFGEDGEEGPKTARSTSPQDGDSDSATEFLVALDYQSDAERKRVEYLLNNRSGIDVEKMRGLARIVRVDDDAEFESFYEDLSAKVDGLDHLRVNELEEIDAAPDEDHERFSLETDASRDQVEWAFETIKRKRDATIEDRDRTGDGSYRQYVATTQSGTVRYSYGLHDVEEGSLRVDIHVWGYGDAPDVMRAFIEDELNYAI